MKLIYTKDISCPADGKEYFPVITTSGEVTGCLPRAVCHNGSKPLHPVVHLHIFNSRGDLFLQKRSLNKDIQPGKWDTAVGGHVDFGETIEEALLREAKEELGVAAINPEYLFSYVFESEIERELVNTYRLVYDGSFLFDPEEIADGRYWPTDEIRSNLGKGVFTPNFEQELIRLTQRELFAL